jgi:hypothetical protein
MLNRLLSNDYPRNRVLAVILVALLLALAFAPFLFPGVKALSVAAKILVFIVLVASFDLLLGYTGIVSFAHTMFFGIGAYGIAIASSRMGPGWSALLVGLVISLALSFVLSLAIGLFSLRVKAIFFAMITLAVATAFQTLASQLSDITGGEDGLTFKMPEVLSPSFQLSETPFLGVNLDGRLLCYYLRRRSGRHRRWLSRPRVRRRRRRPARTGCSSPASSACRKNAPSRCSSTRRPASSSARKRGCARKARSATERMRRRPATRRRSCAPRTGPCGGPRRSTPAFPSRS